MTDQIELRVARIEREADDVRRFVLTPASGAPLPAFTAGAHIDLHLGAGLARSYSLLNSQDDRDRYEIVAIAIGTDGIWRQVRAVEALLDGDPATAPNH